MEHGLQKSFYYGWNGTLIWNADTHDFYLMYAVKYDIVSGIGTMKIIFIFEKAIYYMKRYTVISDYDDNNLETLLSTIHEDFFNNFNVDLNSEKYWSLKNSGMGLEELWHQIVIDCFGDDQTMSPFKEAERFDNMIYELRQIIPFKPKMYDNSVSSIEIKTENGEWKNIDDDIIAKVNEKIGHEMPNAKERINRSAEIIRYIRKNMEYREVEKAAIVDNNAFEILSRMDNEFFSLPNQYSLYETSVWLDATFAIEYIQSIDQKSLKYNNSREYIKAIESINNIYKKRNAYDYIPFSYKDLASGFCDNIKCLLMDRDRARIFDTDVVHIINPKTNKKTYKEANVEEEEQCDDDKKVNPEVSLELTPLVCFSISTNFPVGGYFTCWSYPQIYQLEDDKKNSIQDRLLFYQLTDALLVRHASNEFTKNDIPLSLGRGLMGFFEQIDSVSWRIFLLYLYTDLIDFINNYKLGSDILEPLYQYSPILLSKYCDIINKNAYVLARGLIYVYFNFKYMDVDAEKEYEEVAKKQLNVLRCFDEDLDKKFAEEKEKYDKPRIKSIKDRRKKKRQEWNKDYQNSKDSEDSKDLDISIKMVMQAKADEKLNEYGPRWKLVTKKNMDYETESGIQWYYAFLQRDVIRARKKPYREEDQKGKS